MSLEQGVHPEWKANRKRIAKMDESESRALPLLDTIAN
jgi:hypothetical protein